MYKYMCDFFLFLTLYLLSNCYVLTVLAFLYLCIYRKPLQILKEGERAYELT